MKLWILCAAEADMTWPERCSAEEYRAACLRALESAPKGIPQKPIPAAGRSVYVSRSPLAQASARAVYPDGSFVVTELLDELPPHAAGKGMRSLRFRRLFDRPDRAEKEAALARAETLLDQLAKSDDDAILVSHPGFIALLLDRLRLRGYCVARTGLGRVQPLERLLLTRRDMHCGGCAHNCFLDNPGCGVGRDKAARKSG